MLVVRNVSRHWQLCFEQNHYYGDILEVKGFFSTIQSPSHYFKPLV